MVGKSRRDSPATRVAQRRALTTAVCLLRWSLRECSTVLAERHVSAGRTHACLIRDSDLAITCTGGDVPAYGVLQGDGVTRDINGPFHGVAAGANFTCGLFINHTAACWGLPGVPDGQLFGASAPADALDVVAGERHACILRPDGTPQCIGPGAAGASPPPGVAFLSLSAGVDITCGITRATGGVACWSATPTHPLLPGIPSGSGFVDVAVGDAHACATRCSSASPPLACWGSDSRAYAPLTQRLAADPPVSESAGGPAVLYVTAGAGETCVVLNNATASGSGATVSQQTQLCANVTFPRLPPSAAVIEIACGGAVCLASVCAVGGSSCVVHSAELPMASSPNREVPAAWAGFSWSLARQEFKWLAVASSANGEKLVAVTSSPNVVYLSSDFGATWTRRDMPLPPPGSYTPYTASVTMSADGTRLVASNSNIFFTSSDSGATWVKSRPSWLDWYSSQPFGIAASANGMRLLAVSCSLNLMTSWDGGTTWEDRGVKPWCPTSAAVSADGMRMAAGGCDSPVYVSSDSGVSWTPGPSGHLPMLEFARSERRRHAVRRRRSQQLHLHVL